MRAIHYENGKRTEIERVSTLAELMSRYPHHEVNAYPRRDRPELIAILTDIGCSYSVIRLYGPKRG